MIDEKCYHGDMKKYAKYLPYSVAIAVLVVIFGTMYAGLHQLQRSDANWPQVQIAQDGAAKLDANASPQSLLSNSVDMEKSLAVFTSIYDKSGRTVTGDGFVDGVVAAPPRGVLKEADSKPYHAVTWQPKKGVRIAAVVVKAKNYYVLSGRSLVEIDKSMNTTLGAVTVGGLLSVAIIAGFGWAKRSRLLA